MKGHSLSAALAVCAVIMSLAVAGRADSIGVSYSTVGAFSNCSAATNCILNNSTDATINTANGSVEISFAGASVSGKSVPFGGLTTTSSLGSFSVLGIMSAFTTDVLSTGVVFTLTTTQTLPSSGSTDLGSTLISGNISLCPSCSTGGDVYITFANPGTAASGNGLSGSGPGNFQISPINYQVIFDQGGTSPADSLDLAIGETGQNQKFQLSQASTGVPEPSSMLLLFSGLLPLSRLRRRLLKLGIL